MGLLMLISLSFRMMTHGFLMSPSSFSASYAMPALIEPSPINATGMRSSPFSLIAFDAPTASEIEVELCPAIK